jgi:hypothetical protein
MNGKTYAAMKARAHWNAYGVGEARCNVKIKVAKEY